LYVSLAVLAVALVLVAIFLVLRRRKMQQIPTLPRLGKGKDDQFLLDKLLPQTENLLYNCRWDYSPKLDDELKLNQNDVIAVHHWDKNGWASGNNITTGDKGVFPLICLVEKDLVNKEKIVIPNRTPSTGIVV
jgi:hypothetical protein